MNIKKIVFAAALSIVMSCVMDAIVEAMFPEEENK